MKSQLKKVRFEGNPTLDARVFGDCKYLTDIVLPKKIRSTASWLSETAIPTSLFSGCISLKNITIPESATEIGGAAFEGCTSLESVVIESKTMYRIGKSAFSQCSSLKKVVIPEGVGGIAFNTFIGDKRLEKVYIPETVKEISAYAFHNCNKLMDVYYGGTKEQWWNVTIASNNGGLSNATIHYGASTTDVG